MELEIVEVGPSSRPLRYVPAPAPQWRPPPPPPPLPPPPMTASSSAGNAEAGASGVPVAQQFDSEKLPQTLLEIRPFLRVANQIEAESPRVAYLCRFHAFEKAHMMDPRSTGRGVRQFKTALLQRLEQDEKSTLSKRKERNDAREIKSFYEKKKQANSHELVPVLGEVLKAVLIGTGLESLIAGEDFADKSGLFRYNIIPLHPRSSQQPIMLLQEIKVAVSAVFNVRSLPLANVNDEKTHMDIFRWLQSWFGFQKGNVANQREHLILLLANMHARLNSKSSSAPVLDDRVVDELLAKTFENYLTWCKFLRRKSNIWLPSVKQEIQQHKLLYIALYLLIWGEASNLRLMPECLCFIFHNMSYELYGVLSGAVSLITGEKVRPAYGGEGESFLNKVVTPIYAEISAEALKNKNGVSDHSTWRNYDDLNEFFWSADCFKLGWPMRLNNDFFFTSTKNKNSHQSEVQNPTMPHGSSSAQNIVNSEAPDQTQQTTNDTSQQRWLGKTNFVEILIIMAWHGFESPLQLLDPNFFEDVLSIFITNAVLRVIQVILDIAFSWRTKGTMRFSQKLRFSIKLFLAVTWAIILPIFYSSSQNYACSHRRPKNFLGMFCLSNYMVVVAFYLASNVIGMALFFVPAVSSYIETSTWRICHVLSWWCQPQSYVGRGMHEGQVPLLKYTSFWTLLLSSKFLFSYYFEIKPLVEPTKEIMKVNVNKYEWHEFFPQVKSNAGAILAVWAPIILVYFMDTQIWYSVFCTIFGGMCGIVHHLGEIRTMGMVRSRFCTLPEVFNACLVPRSMPKEKKGILPSFLEKKIFKNLGKSERHDPTKFALVWNQIINSFRSEDLISNREMDLMTMPMSLEYSSRSIRWPLFLLAKKFSKAVDMAANFTGNSTQLFWRIKKDDYMFCAINDFYELTKSIFRFLIIGDVEKRVIAATFAEIEKSIQNSSLLVDFRMDHLPLLVDKIERLAELLYTNKQGLGYEVTILLQDIIDTLIQDMLVDAQSVLDQINSSETLISDDDGTFDYYKPELFASISSISKIRFPFPDTGPLKEQVKRLYLLLNTKEKVAEVPSNSEARRRISFFATSLFMDMPAAPKVRSMLSFSIVTPYFMEEVKFSEDELHSNQDDASILSYMQKIYPDEWAHFLERLGSKVTIEEIRYWASFRGQTLSRTVRGMMYYRKALRLQAFLDRTTDQELYKGPVVPERGQSKRNIHQSLSSELDALADMKFSYVISCQKFGEHKSNGDPHAQDIIELMSRYPALRVAYIEEKEIIVQNRPHKVYSSVLIKAENNLDQEIYRIKLPGPPIIGEGKPENQNHAIIFTRGEALQTIDMNQDNYLEEAYKMRNVLQEFVRHPRDQAPTILGLREHIFTGSVSSLAGFMSYQETSFVTIGQRFLADPLRVRFHYGHPDIFDRMFHLTRGGVSKASKTINLSEDVFAGYNSILRRGHITYNEYIQVGKGRDVGLNQISKFEAKVANGNSEQTLSRDIYRLGRRFDFFRMLSMYFTTVGFYFNSLISVVGIYVFLYGQLYLFLSGLQNALLIKAQAQNMKSLETALASQSFLQLGLLTGLPMVMELGLEKGFRAAFSDFILMQLQVASVFFTFSLGTKAHYYGRTILHGGAKYRPTGRKFVAFHASFTENYQLYSRSHFVKAFELVFLLIIYHIFRTSYGKVHVMVTYSTWFMAMTWLSAPFLFNPAGFAWHKIVDDWADWNRWMMNQGGIGVQPEKSWESWWNAENAHLRHSVLSSRILEVLLCLRFFIYQYGLVYHLKISHDNKNFLVYLLSWVVIIAIVGLVKLVNWASRGLSSKHQLIFRLIKLLIFLAVVISFILLSCLCKLSIMDLIICCLAFIPTGWGLLLIVQVLRPKIEYYAIWEPIQVIAHAYDYGMGSLLFFPIAVLAWMPVISAIQTRVLFNRAFSRQLQIQPFIIAKTKRR
ncbi:putative callose synthase 8 isoform X4 [Brachypodium distachyon]|uniref:putative callose synthase 8 isoform X4 n=1 Tax=Brachypodium distachyon TaxID=15368 RepID=UPI0005300B1F|nr:putative callose synthase 8 isoform X4 [Brachypodium distachyon]|eukprot:XP_010234098.1 putative callose synthase 8 isoform X4 [Brachypodium distachyon]